jgi:3-phosphoshikimate 1-carboxyvinyltransferase
MKAMKIFPGQFLRGEIALPGDKSISHRAALFTAMARGTAKIENFATSADCASTLSCLRDLGIEIEQSGATVTIKGAGKMGFREPSRELDCGNSGTTMRLLAGILAGQDFVSVLTGDDSLRKRPMKRVIEPLIGMGAEVSSQSDRAPIRIKGRTPLHGIHYHPPVASAQLKSCILLAGLLAGDKTFVFEKTPTRDHTERMMRFLGADVALEGDALVVSGDAVLAARDMRVPGDVSSAAFFLVAAACLEGSELALRGVGLNPSRTALLDVLRNFGVDIDIANEIEAANEPVGDLIVRGGAMKTPDSNIINGGMIANLIDELPVLAVFGTQVEGGLEIRDAAELRVKESDRIQAIVENLRRMHAAVEEYPDGFRVERSYLKGACVDSFGDHRIAMAFAVAGLLAEGETEIEGAECAAVSFPAFFDVLARVVGGSVPPAAAGG